MNSTDAANPFSRARLPNYVAEELRALENSDVDVADAWSRREFATTSFRRDILPHADRDDPNFRIVVPVSGGLDSATCYEMALHADLPVVPVIFDTHSDYFRHDRTTAEALTGGRVALLDLPSNGASMVGDFQLGRNSLIVWSILDWMQSNKWWGELWFGNLGGNCLETPIVGGDKSFRWLLAMQQLATATGRDVKVTSPLIGMSKADLVTWWVGRGQLRKALSTRSCFADRPDHCGRCWACLHRYVAFAARGYRSDVLDTYRDGIDFAASVAEVRQRLSWQTVTASTMRTKELEEVLRDLDEQETRLAFDNAPPQL